MRLRCSPFLIVVIDDSRAADSRAAERVPLTLSSLLSSSSSIVVEALNFEGAFLAFLADLAPLGLRNDFLFRVTTTASSSSYGIESSDGESGGGVLGGNGTDSLDDRPLLLLALKPFTCGDSDRLFLDSCIASALASALGACTFATEAPGMIRAVRLATSS